VDGNDDDDDDDDDDGCYVMRNDKTYRSRSSLDNMMTITIDDVLVAR
jgi:hypothetical protein